MSKAQEKTYKGSFKGLDLLQQGYEIAICKYCDN